MVSIRFGGYQGPGSVHTQALRRLAGHVADAGAEVTVDADVTAAGMTARALFDAVEAAGSHQVCYITSGYLTARVPSLAVVDLPFAVADRAAAYAALDGAAGRHIAADILAATGLVVLGFWDNGFRHVSNARRPIRSPADCAGLVIRTLDSPLYAAVIAAMGFTPRITDVRELKRVVANGEVDGQENPLTNFMNFSLYQYHPFVSLTGHLFGVALIACSKAWLDGLPSGIRSALIEGAAEATAAQRALAAGEDDLALRRLAELGMEVLGPDALDLDAFRAATAPVAARAMAAIASAITAAYLRPSA